MAQYIDYTANGRSFIDTSDNVDPAAQTSAHHDKTLPQEVAPGKRYEDYTREDLERAAQINHDEPVGTFVGDRHIKSHEGPEESEPVGVRPNDAYIGAGHFGQDNGDLGQQRGDVYSNAQGFYGAPQPSAQQQQQQYPAVAPGHEAVNYGYDPNDRNFIHDHPIPDYGSQNFYKWCWLTGFQIGSFLMTAGGFGILVVMSLVTYVFNKANPLHKEPPRAKSEKAWEQRITGERFSMRAEYYANFWGYDCEDIDVETEDGFVLRVHHLSSKKHTELGHPVILQHGILSTSVTFMTNEERSLAFWLVEQGYDVFVSNIRTNFRMPHRHYPRSDPRYWAWAVKEIGLYDLPALVSYVYKRTGRKPTYVGHSQGTGSMFLALSRGMRPDIGNMISGFVALGPAVYAGPVLRKFPFSFMRLFKGRKLWSFIFGVREFVPILGIVQSLLPSWLFGHLAYPVFAFIFNFHDAQWLSRQIPKYFRTVAVPNPSELLYYYLSVFSYTNCIFDTEEVEPWFPPAFPPLAIFYGTSDTLVLGRPLVERIRAHEPNVRMLKAVALENYEHQDMLWGVNAVQECYYGIKEFIEETKNGLGSVRAPQAPLRQ